jgi:hypothetical protein
MAKEAGAGDPGFDPEINIFELGQKIRKLDGYIGRASLKLKKRTAQLNKLVKLKAEEEKLLEIGLKLIDPEKAKGNDA